MSQAFDAKELLDRVDNDWDFLAETVQMLCDDGRRLIEQIRAAAATGDAAAVGRAGHALKGMVSNFCSPAAQASALAVEQIGKSGDLGAISVPLADLEANFEVLVAALTDFLATRT
jgi:HPt (histidine-containing phosphotransfer) domain-containing protein